MANKTTKADVAEPVVTETAEVTPEAVAAVEKRVIPIAKLRRSCLDLFGITPSTFDGATDGLTGEYSVEEMKAIIKKWLNKEVK